MSFVISKNKMSFVADDSAKNLSYSNDDAIYIAHDDQLAIGDIDVSDGKINHFIAMVHLFCPGVAASDMPDCRISSGWDGGGETTDVQLFHHMENDSGQSRGVGTYSFKNVLSEVTLIFLPNQAARDANESFTIPANSQILFSIKPQDAPLTRLGFSGPSVP